MGFLTGSLTLIALYAALNPNGANAAQSGANWLVSGLRRLTNPQIAGVPQKAKPAPASSGGGGPKLLAPGPLNKPGGVPESTTPAPGVWI